MSMCSCLGPQNGEPLCPCRMRAAEFYLTRKPAGSYHTGELSSDEVRGLFDQLEQRKRQVRQLQEAMICLQQCVFNLQTQVFELKNVDSSK